MSNPHLRSIYERDEGICYLCGGDVPKPWEADRLNTKATVDHVVPRAAGGGSDQANLRLAHWACNLRKADGPVPDEPYPMPEPGPREVFAISRRSKRWARFAHVNR